MKKRGILRNKNKTLCRKRLLAVILFITFLFPAWVEGQAKKAFINNPPGINLRTRPTTKGSSIITRPYGAEVEVLEEGRSEFDSKYKYYRVRTASGQVGWVYAGDHDDWLVEREPKKVQVTEEPQILYVRSERANFRSTPIPSANTILAVLSRGTSVEVLEHKDSWYKVRLQDGQIGWMAGEELVAFEQLETEAQFDRNVCGAFLRLTLYNEALSCYEDDLKFYTKVNHPYGIAVNLNDIGRVYSMLGWYEKALSKFEETLKMALDYNYLDYVATALSNIGSIHLALGRYEKALYYHKEALKASLKADASDYQISIDLHNIGWSYESLKRYKEALLYYNRQLEINMKYSTPGDKEHTSEILSDIARVYYKLGGYEETLYFYERALKMSKEGYGGMDEFFYLWDMGLVYLAQKKYEEAEKKFLQAQKKYEEEEQRILEVERGLQARFELQAKFKITKQTLEKLRNEGIPDEILENVEPIEGQGFIKEEEFLKAVKKQIGEVQSLRYKEDFLKHANLHPLFIQGSSFYEYYRWTRAHIARSYLLIGKNEEALSILTKITPKWSDSDLYRISFYSHRGLAMEKLGKYKKASYDYLKAVSISEEIRGKVQERTDFLGAGYLGGYIQAYRGLVAVLSERIINGEERDKEFSPYGKDLVSSAFYFSESTKARTLLETIATKSARRYERSEIPPAIRREEGDILNQLSAIENQWEEVYKKGEGALKALLKRKEELNNKLDALILRIMKDYPKYAFLNYPKPFLPEELPLKENEFLVEYTITDKATYLFMVERGNVKQLIKIPKGKEELEAIVNEFLLPLQSPHTKEKFSSVLAQELYRLLLEEVLRDVPSGTHIIIVPDGILGLLPFEALVITPGKDLKETFFVGDQWKISYYQSATVLALNRLLKPSEAQKTFFALGNPIYDKEDPRYIAYKRGKSQPLLLGQQDLTQHAYRGLATRREWGKTGNEDQEEEPLYLPLPETESEIRTLARFFEVQPEPPDVLLNVWANETYFRKSPLQDYRYLHFATHADLPGKIQGVNEPFLLLGQVENQGEDDGFLTLTEVLEIPLDAEMVVLSACVTGRGKVMDGEGVINFARAFHHAGARSVVVSLWEVASAETVEYMKLFYEHLTAGKGRSEALRLARQQIKAKYPNPFYWSVFILHGEG